MSLADRIRWPVRQVLTGLLILGLGLQAAGALTAAEIVKSADRVRFPERDFQVDVDIVTVEAGGKKTLRKYAVLSRGVEKSIVMATHPATEKGQILLMRDNDLWVFLPSASQPVRLPFSQRLTGQVANGDLAKANFSGDYEAKMLRTEVVNGKPHHVLELTAARRGVTYQRVLYWVEQHTNRPYQAEFYTRSGRLLKRATYGRFAELGGAVRPTQLIMEDTLRGGEKSYLRYTGMQSRKLSEKVFTKQYLKKLVGR